jgi:tetratricopeptide (TPR) repeat protein
VLCQAGLSGLYEAVQDRQHITEYPAVFEASFMAALQQPLGKPKKSLPDLTPAHLIDEWVDALAVEGPAKAHNFVFPSDPTLEANQQPMSPFFGDFLSQLRSAVSPGGSEFGVGLTLFSLAATIQAKSIVEIGRFKGFSTLALAAACRLQAEGWADPKASEERPGVDYAALKAAPARVTSIDPAPTPEAENLLERTGLLSFVDFLNQRSDEAVIRRPIDLLFIDGGHTPTDVRGDIQRYVPLVRPGGYFILHDYYGWFTNGQNGSAIAKVIAEDLTDCDQVLIDTHHASLVLFRKTQRLTDPWELPARPPKVPARADGRPTVGLCIIAKGDEVSTVVTRALLSGKKAGVDCVTVVCDANEATADVARSLGADVFVRTSPAIDWEKGFGTIAGARNEALAIAEQRTDYVLVLDADDHFDGELPAVLDKDAYEVTIRDGGLEYQRIQLFRSSYGWRYHGIIHETLQMTGSGPIGRLTTLGYRRGKSSYGYQDQDPPAIKFSKHAQLIRKWLWDHPDDTRAQFYLARSLHDAGRLDEALVAYDLRLTMTGGWHEERAYSAYQMGLIQIVQGVDPTVKLLLAHELGTPRAEPLVALARWYRDETRRQFSTAYMLASQAAAIPQPTDGLFVQPWVYQFEAAGEVAIAAYWLGRKQEALERFEALLPKVPAERRGWAESQIAICLRELR